MNGASVDEFLVRVESEIRARDFQDIASVGLDGGDLIVRFSWMGTSILRYEIRHNDGGFSAYLVRQKMAMMHAPFRASFEERFDTILSRVGARQA